MTPRQATSALDVQPPLGSIAPTRADYLPGDECSQLSSGDSRLQSHRKCSNVTNHPSSVCRHATRQSDAGAQIFPSLSTPFSILNSQFCKFVIPQKRVSFELPLVVAPSPGPPQLSASQFTPETMPTMYSGRARVSTQSERSGSMDKTR